MNAASDVLTTPLSWCHDGVVAAEDRDGCAEKMDVFVVFD